ncbi:MAG TPA: O-antigen ligase family protein [Chitinophagales bacterium]|nr:O-antigen ligase family protein [Chitinophagales bacterium]
MQTKLSIKNYVSENSFQWLIVACCLCIFIGFVTSRAVASIGMIALIVAALLYNGPVETIKQYLKRKELLVLFLFFGIVLFSGLYSADKAEWLTWVRIKLPFIALPLAFAGITRLSRGKFIAILYGFVAIMLLSSAVVLSNYYLNYAEINDSFLRGHAIPIPFKHSHISHIRFTLMIAFAFFCCWYMAEKQLHLLHKNERWMLFFFMVYFFAALHILSVRSSLLALYVGVFVLLVRLIIIKRSLAIGVISLALLTAAPYLAVKYIPSFKNKYEYMRYDYFTYRSGEVKNLSDGIRVVSMKGCIEIAKQNLWLGAGAGDLKTEMANFYASHYPDLPEIDRKMPHNQLLWTLASTGIIGLLLFLLAFLYPLIVNRHYTNWLMLILHLTIFSSFFTEATFEEQIGAGFYLTFLLVLMNQFRNE